jgi:glutamine synthetase
MSATTKESPVSLQATIDALSSQGIHSVFAQFTDIHGVAKGKLVPLQRLPEWVQVGAGFAGPSIWGTGLPRMGPRSEYFGRVVPQSLKPLPFMPGVAHAVCNGFAGGAALATCSRQMLGTQLDALAQRGWRLWVGVEPEFFLLRRDAQGDLLHADAQDNLDKPSYDYKSILRQQRFLDDLRQALTDLGFDLLQIDHEDAASQYEVNYHYAHALEAADRFMLFKMTAHAIAQQHELVFSAMPKPFEGIPGSGLHFHLSITDSAGQPLFADAAQPLGLSTLGQQFAAGLLAHADAVAALCAPTVNSYKRLCVSRSASGTTWSPVWKSLGANNRTCLARAVDGRLEWRLPDSSCNIYAALAATLAAGLEGIDRSLPAVEPCSDDLYERFARGHAMPARLPSNLGAALEALRHDDALRQRIGADFCAEYLQVKDAEWNDWQQHVTPWERARYGSAY